MGRPAIDAAEWRPPACAALAANGALVVAVMAAVVGVALVVGTRYGALSPYRGGVANGGLEDALVARSFLIGRGVAALLFAGAGWYLSRHRPRVVLGPLALAAGLATAVAMAGGQWALLAQLGSHHLPGASVGLWLFNWGQGVEPVVLAAILVLFPDGHWPTGISRWLGVASVSLCVAGLLHGVVQQLGVDPNGPLAALHHPLGLAVLPGLDDFALIFPGLMLGAAMLIVRWRRAEGEQRLILRSLAVVVILTLLTTPLFADQGVVDSLGTIVLLVVIIAGVLRHRVYGIEVVLNRTLVYAVLTALVAAVYAALVGLVNLAGSRVGVSEGLLPTMGAAFVLFPARQRVQRLVNRFLYGQRDEPYAVVSRIGTRLEGAGSAEQLLPGVLESIVQALRVPYAAIELQGDHGALRRIEHGDPTADVERFPLVHQSDNLGHLAVARRSGERVLAPGERRLLEDIARQAAVAAANVVLTQELVRSRERIINAAEEERRRLRRDLHDGLGPVLTAAATRVDASRNLIRRDADQADDLLREVRSDLTTALDDLRRLVYALRPPALDQLGLLGALREHVRGSSIPVVLHLPATLPELGPALEVAAYRIVIEALTNVVRHAGASGCTLTIACDGNLQIDVSDDGIGTGAWAPGVGLSSMRERTVELGGRWTAGPASETGGGRVMVEFPLAAADTGTNQ